MAKFIATIKAVITRLVFGTHGFIAIWQVAQFKKSSFYWYLSSPILLLFFEGIFTLTIKENQEWKWFCPSVFLYLSSVVPAIWLLELDKVDRRMRAKVETINLTANADLKELQNLLGGVQIKLPEIQLSAETWVTLIEQFLMLILIIGRWMLPKGDLTRDQLSQLLLVYIGTAADIIEFFDSFKDDKIASEPLLVLLTLAIWSWSLLQFTVVLTATKSRKSRLSATASYTKTTNCRCCNLDVWGILLNIALQDAPFLAFRLLIILHFNIISYMNVFFTCKNTLVILLQLYRLYVVYSESGKQAKKKQQKRKKLLAAKKSELRSVAVISDSYEKIRKKDKIKLKKSVEKKLSSESEEESDIETKKKRSKKKLKEPQSSTASSKASTKKITSRESSKEKSAKTGKKPKKQVESSSSSSSSEVEIKKKKGKKISSESESSSE